MKEFVPIYIFLFLLGGVLGSFYFTLAERILEFFYTPKRKQYKINDKWKHILFTPSHCNSCQTKISSVNLIPIFGILFSKFRCKACGYKIPKLYLFAEILFSLIPAVLYFTTGNLGFAIAFTCFTGHLLIPIFTDSQYFSLDYENLPFLVFFGSLSNFFLGFGFLSEERLYVLGGFFLFYLCLYFLSRRGMGLGDVIFAPFFAALAGHPFWMFFLNSSYVLGLLGTFLLKKKSTSWKNLKIPMGVYFSMSIFFSFLAKVYFQTFDQR